MGSLSFPGWKPPGLVEAYEDGKLQGPLKEIAADLEEESNPVIMIARYKNE